MNLSFDEEYCRFSSQGFNVSYDELQNFDINSRWSEWLYYK